MLTCWTDLDTEFGGADEQDYEKGRGEVINAAQSVNGESGLSTRGVPGLEW